MFVIPLTLAISLGLVAIFVAFFLKEHERAGRSGAERDSILPLADETPRIAGSRAPAAEPAKPR